MSFAKAMQRPANYHSLSEREQWSIDKMLGILDWDGKTNEEETEQYNKKFGTNFIANK